MLPLSLRSYAYGNATLLPAEETDIRVLGFLLRENAVNGGACISGVGRWKESRLIYKEALEDDELWLCRRRSVVGESWESETVVTALGGRGDTDSVHSAISIPRDCARRVFSASVSALRRIWDGGTWNDGDGGTAGNGMVA